MGWRFATWRCSMDPWSANIIQSTGNHRNVGGVGIYVYRARWRGRGRITSTYRSKHRNVGGLVGGLFKTKMAITPSSAYVGPYDHGHCCEKVCQKPRITAHRKRDRRLPALLCLHLDQLRNLSVDGTQSTSNPRTLNGQNELNPDDC